MTQRLLRAALESAPTGILMTDREGRIVLLNVEIERMFGYSREELVGRSIDLLVPERFRGRHSGYRGGFLADPQARAMGAGRDLFGVAKDGTEVPVEIGLTPVVTNEGPFVISSIVDISARKVAESERRALEHQLRESQKLEALGTLAGGIAHDFNNLLASIIGYAELALRAPPGAPTAREDLGKLLSVAERARGVVERILAFSRHSEHQRQVLNLGRAVGRTEELLRAAIPARVRLSVIKPETPAWISADETSLHQVVMNLVNNAAQAMPEGGEVEVRVEPMYVHDHMVRDRPSLHEGHYAVLRVRDSGPGIPPHIRDRIFEPFFTTKEPGEGTGLGLAIVRNIMAVHQGLVELSPEGASGTEFTCYFPAVAPELAEPSVVARGPGRPGQGQLVLYVDDEPNVRDVTTRQIALLEYGVTGAASGKEALDLLEHSERRFDLIISDYSMPMMNGLQFARAAHALRPDVPILMFTGYMEDLDPAELEQAGVRKVLRKPVPIALLEDVLAEMLP